MMQLNSNTAVMYKMSEYENVEFWKAKKFSQKQPGFVLFCFFLFPFSYFDLRTLWNKRKIFCKQSMQSYETKPPFAFTQSETLWFFMKQQQNMLLKFLNQ